MCIILCIWLFEVEFILNNITFSGIVCDLFVAVGYLKNRWTWKNTNSDKLKIPIAIHVIYCLVLILLTIVPLITNPVASASAFLLVVASASLYYFLIVKTQLGDKWMRNTSAKLTIHIQRLFYCAPAEKSD